MKNKQPLYYGTDFSKIAWFYAGVDIRRGDPFVNTLEQHRNEPQPKKKNKLTYCAAANFEAEDYFREYKEDYPQQHINQTKHEYTWFEWDGTKILEHKENEE
jgi:hypothetical protein